MYQQLSHRHRSQSRHLLVFGLLLASMLLSAAFAQAFDPDRYYRQCLAFEQGGDFETARQSCLNALAAEPRHDRARLALARIELELGDLAAAESRLLEIDQGSNGAEPQLLLAELYIHGGRHGEAEAALTTARQRLGAGATGRQAARRAALSGELAQRQGRFDEALEHLRESVRLAPDTEQYRLQLASLHFDMGDAEAAQAELEDYLRRTGGAAASAELSSLLGWSLWAQSDLTGAARELERALGQRNARDGTAQARDLRALGLVYYALGDGRAGGLALREAARRGNLFTTFFADNLAWLLLLLLLLAVHLIAESRIGVTSSADTGDGPRTWSVGQAYGIAGVSLLVALPTAVAYGVLRYDNLLALLTPVQSSDSLAVFFIAFSLLAAAGAWRRTARNGWSPGATLLGGGERVPAGVLLGVVMLAATLAYRNYMPDWEWRGDFFLDLAHLTPALALALAVIPVSELFFRAFAFPAFESRYGTGFAVIISGSLSALVFASPVLLLLAIGLVMASIYRTTRSGALTFTAQLTLHLGLLLAVAFFPWARSLFV